MDDRWQGFGVRWACCLAKRVLSSLRDAPRPSRRAHLAPIFAMAGCCWTRALAQAEPWARNAAETRLKWDCLKTNVSPNRGVGDIRGWHKLMSAFFFWGGRIGGRKARTKRSAQASRTRLEGRPVSAASKSKSDQKTLRPVGGIGENTYCRIQV